MRGIVPDNYVISIHEELNKIIGLYNTFIKLKNDVEIINLTKELLEMQKSIIEKTAEEYMPIGMLDTETYFDVEQSIFQAYFRLTNLLLKEDNMK